MDHNAPRHPPVPPDEVGSMPAGSVPVPADEPGSVPVPADEVGSVKPRIGRRLIGRQAAVTRASGLRLGRAVTGSSEGMGLWLPTLLALSALGALAAVMSRRSRRHTTTPSSENP